MNYGFHGFYFRVDLSTDSTQKIPLPASVPRRYLGGVGLGAWLLHHESPAGVDPLGPEAALIFSFSPLVGTAVTTSAKFATVAKSPLTGLISDGLSSSDFAISGKRMGVDAIVFVGRSPEPCVWVCGELRPTDQWGQSAQDTENALRAEGSVAAIGVAGENQVRFATISNGGRHAGRGGLGAVMGSKNLKAVVVRGDVSTPVARPAELTAIARDLAQRSLGPETARYREQGTVGNLSAFNRLAILPTRNFQHSQLAGAEDLASALEQGTRASDRTACASCTIGCEHHYRFSGNSVRLEYESLFALGPLCGIADAEDIVSAAQRCDEWGIDTVSAGATVAFAMECSERGLLDAKTAPRFGDAPALLEALDNIAHRRGLGDQLAQGTRRMAHALGQNTIAFAPQVKGLEIPGYEPRALQAMALGFAVGTRGADHNRSGAYEVDLSEKADRLRGNARSAQLATETENQAALLDSLILCKFLRGIFSDLPSEAAEILGSVTGWDIDAGELEAVAQRIISLRKAFNIREGWSPEDDTLPSRFLQEPLRDGASSGAVLPEERLKQMVRTYNLTRGWDADGHLPAAVLDDLSSDFPGPVLK